jgi:hypothetical protein
MLATASTAARLGWMVASLAGLLHRGQAQSRSAGRELLGVGLVVVDPTQAPLGGRDPARTMQARRRAPGMALGDILAMPLAACLGELAGVAGLGRGATQLHRSAVPAAGVLGIVAGLTSCLGQGATLLCGSK